MDSNDPKPHRVDHVWVSHPVRVLHWLSWLFLRRHARGAWLVLMDTGEIRLYDVVKRDPLLEGRRPSVARTSPADVRARFGRTSLRGRFGNKRRRLRFSGRERAPGAISLLPILGELGELLEWLKEGVEKVRTHHRRREAYDAWKAILSGTATAAEVPGNVETKEAQPPAAPGITTPAG
jgi:hypothetical protein